MDGALRRRHRPPRCPRNLYVENVSVLNGEYWSLVTIDKERQSRISDISSF